MKGANSMAPPGLGFKEALVEIVGAVSFLLCLIGLRKRFRASIYDSFDAWLLKALTIEISLTSGCGWSFIVMKPKACVMHILMPLEHEALWLVRI